MRLSNLAKTYHTVLSTRIDAATRLRKKGIYHNIYMYICILNEFRLQRCNCQKQHLIP